MEYSLQGYFDIGVSYGLGDDVFKDPGDATVPDILKIGSRRRRDGIGI
jgi:hypothetical protein